MTLMGTKRVKVFFDTLTTMVLDDKEYRIEGEGIWISKDTLAKYRNHYGKVADQYKKEDFRYGLYLGKADIMIDLLKMFEPLVGD